MLVSILSLLVFIIITPSHVLGGDNGEFVALSRINGVAHPPGYPLYILYLRLMSWLPGSAAKSSAIATALIGGLQILFVYMACRKWGAKPIFAAFASAYYASSALSLILNTHAEVFALNNLFAAIILFLAGFSSLQPAQSVVLLIAASLLQGLSWSHHHSFVLLSPLLVCILYKNRGVFCSFRWPWLSLVMAAAFLVGLLPNLLLFEWSRDGIDNLNSWGNINSIGSLLHHFLRRDYGTFSLSAGGAAVEPIGQLGLLFWSIYWSWNIIIPFVLIGFAASILKLKPCLGCVSRLQWLALLSSFILSGPVFVVRFNISLKPPGPAILERFHFLPVLLLVVPAAVGLQYVVGLYRSRFGSIGSRLSLRSVGLNLGMLTVLAFPFLFNGAIAMPLWRDRSDSVLESYLVGSLEILPSNSVIFVAADHKVFGYTYLLMVRRLRPDVTMITPAFLRFKWYRDRLGLPDSGSPASAMTGLLRRYLGGGRPIFVDSYVSTTFKGFRTYQLGLFKRIMANDDSAPDPSKLLGENLRAYSLRYDAKNNSPVADNGWAGLVRRDVTISLLSLSRYMNALGRNDLASIARKYSVELGICPSNSCGNR